VRRVPDAEQVVAAAVLDRAEAVLLATSLTCAPMLHALRSFPGWVASIETCWMPWIRDHRGIVTRLDQILLLMPTAAWEAGLAENGGPFDPPERVRVRTAQLGWGVEGDPNAAPQDLALLYLGQRSDPERNQRQPVWVESVGPAIEQVAAAMPDLQWLQLGTLELDLPGFVEHRPWVSADEFRQHISSAALLVAHHGMGTIQKALTAGTPVLSLANGDVFQAEGRPPWSADQEVHALVRAGLVDACYGPVPPAVIARRMRALLKEGRREPAPGGGAREAVIRVERALEGR